MPATYALEEEQINAALRSKSIIHHPDRFANASEEEIQSAEKSMAELNHAHAKLNSPLKRAFALLSFYDKPCNAEETVKDTEFLMEMFEINEELSEAKKSQEEENIKKILEDLKAQEVALIDDLHLQFSIWEEKNNSLECLPKINEMLMRLQYLTKLIEDNT